MVTYNPFDWATAHNPYPVYQQLRDEAPVYHNEQFGFWALSRYDDVIAGHLNPEDFSSAHGTTIAGMEKDAPFLIVKDPPEHTAHRKIVARLFTPRRIAQLEPFIRRTAARLLDDLRRAGPVRRRRGLLLPAAA
jgi:cytochrome P450